MPGGRGVGSAAPSRPSRSRSSTGCGRTATPAYVVGGSLRDVLLGRTPADWDLATDARPERIVELFPGAVYENRFGTVAVRRARRGRTRSRPSAPTTSTPTSAGRTGSSSATAIEDDLARRDFTVNAMAWGGRRRATAARRCVDPFGGLADLEARLLRAVGDPDDAVRRGRPADGPGRPPRGDPRVRRSSRRRSPRSAPAAELVAPPVRRADRRRARRSCSGAERPSVGLRLARVDRPPRASSRPSSPPSAAMPQNKIAGRGPLGPHAALGRCRAGRTGPIVRLAALLHDIGKPATLADGHFHRPRRRRRRARRDAAATGSATRARRSSEVAHLVRHHMFTYDPAWSDAGVRRFIARIGRDAPRRRCSSCGGPTTSAAAWRRTTGGLDELPGAGRGSSSRPRSPLDRATLAVDGDDLMAELGARPGPRLGGRPRARSLDAVVADPALNDRATLLMLAQVAPRACLRTCCRDEERRAVRGRR